MKTYTRPMGAWWTRNPYYLWYMLREASCVFITRRGLHGADRCSCRSDMKRSNKPVFWSLFGAGGMLCALVGPALIYITGIAVPFGIMNSETLAYERVTALAHNGFGKLALFLVISLFLFHGCHRMYHCLHDFGIHVGPGLKAAFHGFAAAGSAAAEGLFSAGCRSR